MNDNIAIIAEFTKIFKNVLNEDEKKEIIHELQNDSKAVLTKKLDLFETPKHYQDMGEYIFFVIKELALSFEEANVLKYLERYKKKDGINDLKKAQHYITYCAKNNIRKNHVIKDTFNKEKLFTDEYNNCDNRLFKIFILNLANLYRASEKRYYNFLLTMYDEIQKVIDDEGTSSLRYVLEFRDKFNDEPIKKYSLRKFDEALGLLKIYQDKNYNANIYVMDGGVVCP